MCQFIRITLNSLNFQPNIPSSNQTRISPSEKLASLGIKGTQLKAPPETPYTSQQYGTE